MVSESLALKMVNIQVNVRPDKMTKLMAKVTKEFVGMLLAIRLGIVYWLPTTNVASIMKTKTVHTAAKIASNLRLIFCHYCLSFASRIN